MPEGDEPSFWCVWAFINVFHWELRELHHESSPVNGDG